MKQLYIAMALLMPTAASLQASAERSHHSDIKFMPQSKLASGKWVKIGIDRTGVFEISHTALRSMGFNDPENVAVFGRGGRQLDMNFVDADGKQLYTDGLTPVAVTHAADKLYFYAEGPDEFEINTRNANVTDGYFVRKNRNIYSSTGYYFITDSASPTIMETEVFNPFDDDGNFDNLDYGYGMVSHEVDLLQNGTNTGQVFYGEYIGGEISKLSWPTILPDAIPGSEATLECSFYLNTEGTGSWSFGIIEDPSQNYYPVAQTPSSTLRKLSPLFNTIEIPGEKVTVYTEINTGAAYDISNLDYWTLTYRRGIPSLKYPDNSRMNQDMVAFPNMSPADDMQIRIPGGATYMALDVTSPANPRILEIIPDGADGIARISYNSMLPGPPRIVVFDPLMTQYTIKGFETGYSKINNQNLHAKAAEGGDLVIICIPQLKDAATRLALLHEKYDGLKSVIATTDECYNEYSEGVPDPMAYRAFVKSVYSSEHPCKNVLLLGPLYADFRGVVNEKQPDEGVVAYQSPILIQDKGAQNANSIIGMMADNINVHDIHLNDMEVGLGILPARYNGEADLIISKIERFMNEENIELYLNAFTNIGGVGDTHTHDTQAINLSNHIDRLTEFSTICTNLPVDAYGDREAQKKLFSDLNEGRLIVNYFGHGSGMQLNNKGDFLTAADIYRLRNKHLPFIAFAGCSLSSTDIGSRGMGESIVLSTRYGTIGSLLATRETWSGENELLFQAFYTNMFRDGQSITSPNHAKALTIGEIFARTMTHTRNNNELAYQLICDPALVLPITTRRVHFTSNIPDIKVGERMTVSGYVADQSGKGGIDPTFNGKAVVRVMEPFHTYISDDLCSGDPAQLRVPVGDTQIAMATADVVDGKFSVDFFIPTYAARFNNEPGRIHVAVYSPEIRTAGGGLLTGIYRKNSESASAADSDKYPPVIEHLIFDPESMELNVRVSDNLALGYCTNPLNPSFRLVIDGKEEPAGFHTSPRPDPYCEAYSRSIPLYNLTEDTHTARVTAYDAAGNTATAETTFTYHPISPRLALRLRDGVADGRAVLIADSEIPDSADVVIINAAGEQVRREAFSASGFEWDLLDSRGRHVAPGLYKAYLIETGASSRKAHSPLTDIPVVGQ